MAEARVERRLAAILAADVAGYSRLMGADEVGTLAALKALRREIVDPAIAAHHGRIVKTTGDGLLVEFASAVDAVTCATAVQERMAERTANVSEPRIQFRVGINIGDVMIDGDDIFGDGVNVAARIENECEPGGVYLSDDAYRQVRGKTSFAFDDIGERSLKNIALPVRVHRVRPGGETGAVIAPALPLPDKPSIAVLPFVNMSNDAEQEFLADGVAEDIFTALSRFPSLFVIARNSSFTYKGRTVDVKAIGRELGVRYVLEGSLRKAGSRIRVSVQLIEAETGKHLCAERYDRNLAGIFALQDEISEAVTLAVAPAINEAELQRAMRKPPQNLDAWTAYQRGLWHVEKMTADDTRLAEQFFQKAIDLDPSFAGGYNGLSYARFTALLLAAAKLAEVQSSTDQLARRAVALDPANAEAHVRLSMAFFFRGDLEGTRGEAERALALSPNLAEAHFVKGLALISSGEPKKGLAAVESALRLDPRSPSRANQLLWVAFGHYFCREYEAAAEAAKQAIRSYPDYALPYFWLAEL